MQLGKKPKNRLWVLGLSLWLIACSGASARQAVETSEGVAGLSAERYQQRVTYFASDELSGRASGSPGLEKAADYIAAQFRDLGLKPAGERNSFFQPFEI